MTITDLKDKHKDAWWCYIIGKGPTLDKLDSQHIYSMRKLGPVFCCNEAVRKVEIEAQWVPVIGGRPHGTIFPIYAVQQDSELEDHCVPQLGWVHFMHFFQHTSPAVCDISGAKLPVSKERCKISPWNKNAVLYGDGADGSPSVRENELTAVAALKIAHYMGIRSVCFVAFDSWSGEPGEYAKCIGTESSAGGDIGRHAPNGHEIREQAKALMDKVQIFRMDGGPDVIK